MSVLVDNNTRLIVQGITARSTFHAKGCAEYGTKVVAVRDAGQGRHHPRGGRVFNTVEEAVKRQARTRP